MDGHRASHDWDEDVSLSCSIVEAIAEVRGRNVTEIEPLHSVIDPDALDKLFVNGDEGSSPDPDGVLEFSFEEYRVRVRASGEITILPLPDGTSESVADEAQFQEALETLVREAESNGIDFEGAWAIRDGSTSTDWGLEIYEVKRSEPED